MNRDGDFYNPASSGNPKSRKHKKVDHYSTKKPKKIGNGFFGISIKTRKLKKTSAVWGYAKVFFSAFGAILLYGMITNITLLNGGIDAPADPVAHNLAYILSCIASGGVLAMVCYSYVDQEAIYVSPVDVLLSWFHKRPDTTFWYTMSRLLGLLAGAYASAGLVALIYRDSARVQLAATVVNPFNKANNDSDFAAFAFETLGMTALAMIGFILDAKYRSAVDRALIKGFSMTVLRLAVYQYTGASFNVFLSLAMNSTQHQWNTFLSGSYYIYWLAAGVSLVIGAMLIVLMRYFARYFTEYDKKLYEVHGKSEDKTPASSTDNQGHPAIKLSMSGNPLGDIEDDASALLGK